MDESPQRLHSGQVGRIVGSDETMFKEYANRPEATHVAKRDDLVISDDIGFRDEQGYFYILGREEDVVILADSTISVTSIENDIRESFSVQEFFVGIARRTGAIDVAVLAVPTPEVEPDISGIKAFVERRFSPIPANVLVRIVAAIPKLASGKVDRIKARALAVTKADER
jgi:acyl-coenzyme A synthetase/AMP-(fatty) acid ligase